MPHLFLVMLGGAIGAGFRYQVGRFALGWLGPQFPWGTFIVNLAGGFLMGVLAGTLGRLSEGGEAFRLFLGVGVLGGFTTFSAFSLEAANMLMRGQAVPAAAYSVASVAGSVMFLFLGLWLASRIVG